MDAQHTAVDNLDQPPSTYSCNIQIVEHLTTALPNSCAAIFLHAFVCVRELTRTVEAIDLGDLATFVVSTQQRNPVRISCLECEQER